MDCRSVGKHNLFLKEYIHIYPINILYEEDRFGNSDIPLIPALGRQRKEDLYEFQASLIYKVGSKMEGLLHREELSQKKNQKVFYNRCSQLRWQLPKINRRTYFLV